MSRFEQLVYSFDDLWSWMRAAPESRRHPMRAPTCITVDAHGPRGRTMILRDVLEEHLIFFTDKRSSKVAAVRSNPKGALHGYDRKRSLQIQCSGLFSVIESHPKSARWRAQGLQRFKDYGAPEAPGQPRPKELGTPTLQVARKQFVVIGFTPQRIELLQLSALGHRRAEWCRQHNLWTVRHLVP